MIPVVIKTATLVSSYGTEQFMTYLSAMREVENLVREGKQISCPSAVDVQENGAIGPVAHDKRGEAPRNVPQDCSFEGTLILQVAPNLATWNSVQNWRLVADRNGLSGSYDHSRRAVPIKKLYLAKRESARMERSRILESDDFFYQQTIFPLIIVLCGPHWSAVAMDRWLRYIAARN